MNIKKVVLVAVLSVVFVASSLSWFSHSATENAGKEDVWPRSMKL